MTDIVHVKMIATYVKKSQTGKIFDQNWMGNQFHAEKLTNPNIKKQKQKNTKNLNHLI